MTGTERPSELHLPVMPAECIDILGAERGGLYVDATLGLGGHSERMLEASTDTQVIGIDQDSAALDHSRKRLEPFGKRFTARKGNFAEIEQILERDECGSIDGILADIGVSSLQFDSAERGFSFRFDAPLDMRMDPESGGETAAELLQRLSETEIADIIYRYGEERVSRKIARWIVERREAGEPVTTTTGLADLVRRAVRTSPKDKIHPATRTFQALRIAVNDELGVLSTFLADAVKCLKKDGVLAVITFHSLEDRIVKQAFQRMSGKCSCPPRMPKCMCGAERTVEVITRKPILPSDEELSVNPRSRSAKLRACRKI